MKLIIENWKRYLNESVNDLEKSIKMIKDMNHSNCYKINSMLTNSFTKSHRLECLGVGTDKYVFKDSQRPNWVLKFEKVNPIKEYSTMETVVWKYLKNSPLAPALAPIESHDGYYYMKLGQGGGDINQLRQFLHETFETIGGRKKDINHYFLADAGAGNIRKINGFTVLIDYDEVYGWLVNNKDLISKY